jgi:hypothetical protein
MKTKLAWVKKNEAKLIKQMSAFSAKMSALRKKISKQDKAAEMATKTRLRTTARVQKRIALKLHKLRKEGKRIPVLMAKAKKKHHEDLADIQGAYRATLMKLRKKNRANVAKLATYQSAFQKRIADRFRRGAAKLAFEKAALAASERRNKKASRAWEVKFKNRTAAERAKRKRVALAYQKEVAVKKKVETARRSAFAHKMKRIADRNKRRFEEKAAKAAILKKKAKAAADREKNAKKTSEKRTKAEKKLSEEQAKKDSQIKSCAWDGSECKTKDGKCHKIGKNGPYMAKDFVSCTKTKPAKNASSGLSWQGLDFLKSTKNEEYKEPKFVMPKMPRATYTSRL